MGGKGNVGGGSDMVVTMCVCVSVVVNTAVSICRAESVGRSMIQLIEDLIDQPRASAAKRLGVA